MKSYWTTILTGIVGAVVGCLTSLGYLDQEESENTLSCVADALEGVPHAWDSLPCQEIASGLVTSMRDDLGIAWVTALLEEPEPTPIESEEIEEIEEGAEEAADASSEPTETGDSE